MARTNAEEARERRARNYVTPKDPNDPRHGTASFYQNHGCRCDRCTKASTGSDRRRRDYREMVGCRCGCRLTAVSQKRVDEVTEQKSFSVMEYTNRQGSRIIAVLDADSNWNVLCMASPGHIHYFKWDTAQLQFDVGDAEIVERTV